ncbi:MAG: hypothetical protein AB9836_04980 [Aminipila sp.]
MKLLKIICLSYLFIYPEIHFFCVMQRGSIMGGGEVLLYYSVITYFIIFMDKPYDAGRTKERILLDDIKLVNDYRKLPMNKKDWDSAEWLITKSINSRNVSKELIDFFTEALEVTEEEFKATYCIIEKYERGEV